jgi:uncharacterized damage-inducible protein DinB
MREPDIEKEQKPQPRKFTGHADKKSTIRGAMGVCPVVDTTWPPAPAEYSGICRISAIRLASVLCTSEAFVNRPPVWFERKFEFTFPLNQHPNLCARLRGTPARLEELVRGSSRDQLIKKPGEKWSAQEHAGHLLDLEPLWMARVDDYLADGSELTAADLKNRKTHEANHNARALEQILREFREARLRLVKRVETADPALFARSMLHPRLKQAMRLVDHLYFVAEHDDHHLACIWELLNRSNG